MKEAIILAGGHGWRLKPYTYVTKPLLEIHKAETLLRRQVGWLLNYGFDKIHVSIGDLTPEQVKRYTLNSKVLIHQNQAGEDKPGTGGGLYRTIQYVKSNIVYVFNVDDILFYNPNHLLKSAINISKIVVAFPDSPWGVVDYKDGLVTDFVEKPKLSFTVSVGHYCFFREDVEHYCPEKGDLEKEMLPDMADDGILGVYVYHGEWLTLNTYKDLLNVRKHFNMNPLYLDK